VTWGSAEPLLVLITAPPSTERQQSLGEKVGSLEQDPREPVEHLLGRVREQRSFGNPRVVDQEVEVVTLPDLAQRRTDRLAEAGEGVSAADIEGQRGGRSALLLDDPYRLQSTLGAAAVGQNHTRPARGDPDRRALPDAGASAGNDRDLHGHPPAFACSLGSRALARTGQHQ
jgi:hypothetical protein